MKCIFGKYFSKNKSLENKYISIAIFLFSFLFLGVLPLGHDLNFHIYRIGGMAKELEVTGYGMPIRILSDSFNGYGYGVPLFYGDILLYIPAILVSFGMHVKVAYQLLMVSIWWMCYFSMKYAVKRATNQDKLAIYAAFIYVFSPYLLTTLWIRGALGEAGAFLFLPLVFGAFYNILYLPREKDWLQLAIGMVGILLTHNLSALFAACIMAVWGGWELLQKRQGMGLAIKKLVIATLMTVFLVASYLFPLLEAENFQKYQTPSINEYQIGEFSNHILSIWDFLFPYDIQKIIVQLLGNYSPIPQSELVYWQPGFIGVWIGIFAIFICYKRKLIQYKGIFIVTIICSILYGMLMSPYLVNKLAYIISFMQFPWRMLNFITSGITICGAYTIYTIQEKNFNCEKNRIKFVHLVMIGIIAMGIFTIGARYAYQIFINVKGNEYIQEVNPEFASNYIMEYDRNNGDNLYLPEGTNFYLFEERGEVITANHKDVTYDFCRIDNQIRIHVGENKYTDTVLELPLYMYKGYTAVISGGEELKVNKSPNHLVEVEIGAQKNVEIIVEYQGTKVQKLSDCITLVGVIVCIYFGLLIPINGRKEKGEVGR